MTATPPVISVVIPCYNQARFLADAVEGALGERDVDVQVVVVDDGSTDDTAAVAARYGARVEYVYRPNGGLFAARNTGLTHATGEYVHFLDADDYVREGFYRSVAAATAAGGACFHTGWDYVREDGALMRSVDATPIDGDPFGQLLDGNRFPPCAVVARTAAVREVGGFRGGYEGCEDWDLWLRLAAAGGRFRAVPGASVAYRRHGASMSTDYPKMWAAGRRVLYDVVPVDEPARLRRAVRRWRAYCVRRLLADVRDGGGVAELGAPQIARKVSEALAADPGAVGPLLSDPRRLVGSLVARGTLRDAPEGATL